MRRVPSFDMPLFLCILTLVGLGIIFIYSASYPKALASMETGGNSFSFAGRQIIFALLGLAAMFTGMFTPLDWLRKYSRWILGLVIIAMLGVLVLNPGKHGNNAWYNIGSFTIQPSEYAKIAIVLALSAYLVKRPWMIKSWKGLLSGPYLFLMIPVGVIVMQGDLGTAAVVTIATVAMLAIAGTKFRFWGLPLLVMLCLGAMVVLTSHRAERIQAWMNPMDTSIEASHQPRMSLIAVGTGGWLGMGFCQSRQKYHYLPASQNDYIFAIIAEELGLLRLLLFLLVPYMFLMYRGFTIAHRAPDEFTALVAMGCTVMLIVQALINMAVVLNLMPAMGINLPFISYGGSSIIASMLMAGVLLNVSAQKGGVKAHQPSPGVPQSVIG